MPKDGPIRISVGEAKEKLDAGATPLDVIDSPSYDDFDLQIEGAVRLAPENVGEDFDKLPQDRSVLTY